MKKMKRLIYCILDQNSDRGISKVARPVRSTEQVSLVGRAVSQNALDFAASRSTEPLDPSELSVQSSSLSDMRGMLIFDLPSS